MALEMPRADRDRVILESNKNESGPGIYHSGVFCFCQDTDPVHVGMRYSHSIGTTRYRLERKGQGRVANTKVSFQDMQVSLHDPRELGTKHECRH